MKNKLSFIAAILSLSLAANLSANDTLEELKACARTPDQESRYACFETLSKKVLAADQSATTTNGSSSGPADEAAQTLTGLPDSIGGGEFADAAGVKKESYRGHVKACKPSSDRKWFYIFENGQVWKQVDRRKRRYKSCDFDVVLTEDNFGYVMQIEGDDSKIRVDRRR